MGDKFYIFNNCKMRRKDNNIRIESEDRRKDIKSEIVNEIYVFGEVDFNTKLLNFLSQKGIALHIYNYYGYYSGSFYPREQNVSGELLVRQVENYLDLEKRIYIAKEFITAASKNILRNLKYYNTRGKDLDEEINYIEALIKKIDSCKSIESLMGIEGNIHRKYYSTWSKIIDQEIDFKKRVKRPPDNMINSLISYLNSMMYSDVLNCIVRNI